MLTLTVNTRRGPITFTTELEYEEAHKIVCGLGAQGNAFAASLVSKRRLSPIQIDWVYKLAQDTLTQPKAEKASSLAGVDVSNILAHLTQASVSGLKKPAIRLGGGVKIKYMSRGTNAGGCWVTIGEDLAGKIDANGVFTTRHAKGAWLTELMVSTNADVESALVSYGRETCSCSCCGLPLTNELSVALGIGPICREKFGLGG